MNEIMVTTKDKSEILVLVKELPDCAHCGKTFRYKDSCCMVSDFFARQKGHQMVWDKKLVKYYCPNCIQKKKVRVQGRQNAMRIVRFVHEIPHGATLFDDNPTTMQYGKNMPSVWKIAYSDDEINADTSNVKVKYKQIKSTLPKKGDAVDYVKQKELTEQRINELDAPLKSDDDGLAYLDGLANAKPYKKEKPAPLIDNAPIEKEKIEDKSEGEDDGKDKE